jgi:hypothetical protein
MRGRCIKERILAAQPYHGLYLLCASHLCLHVLACSLSPVHFAVILVFPPVHAGILVKIYQIRRLHTSNMLVLRSCTNREFLGAGHSDFEKGRRGSAVAGCEGRMRTGVYTSESDPSIVCVRSHRLRYPRAMLLQLPAPTVERTVVFLCHSPSLLLLSPSSRYPSPVYTSLESAKPPPYCVRERFRPRQFELFSYMSNIPSGRSTDTHTPSLSHFFFLSLSPLFRSFLDDLAHGQGDKKRISFWKIKI